MTHEASSKEQLSDEQRIRFARQIRFEPFGEKGQALIQKGRALIVGMGALGSAVAETLARAGTGMLRIVDGDVLQIDNLHRQTLYTDEQARERAPKVEAACLHLNRIAPGTIVESMAVEASDTNIDELMEEIDITIDCTDRFATRFMMNDAAVRNGVPLVHGACVGCDGQVLVIIPGETACLRCLMPDGPIDDAVTCENTGVMMPIASAVAAIQSMEAIKLLSGNRKSISNSMTVFSLWENRIRQIGLEKLFQSTRQSCPVCGTEAIEKMFERPVGVTARSLCGRMAVQVTDSEMNEVDLIKVAPKLNEFLIDKASRFVLKMTLDGYAASLFADGRLIVEGTEDVDVAIARFKKISAAILAKS